MGGLLTALFAFCKCLLVWFGALILSGLVLLVNAVVSALAALIGTVLGLVPNVDLGSSSLGGLGQGFAWANYFLPLDLAVTLLGVVVTVLVAWWLLSIALRWARAVP